MRIAESVEGLERIRAIVSDFRGKVVSLTTEIQKNNDTDTDQAATEINFLAEEIRKKTEVLASDVIKTVEIRSKALREYNALAYNKGNY